MWGFPIWLQALMEDVLTINLSNHLQAESIEEHLRSNMSKRTRMSTSSEAVTEIDPSVAVINLDISEKGKSSNKKDKKDSKTPVTPKVTKSKSSKSAPPKASKKKKVSEGTSSEGGTRARLEDLDYLGYPKSSSLKDDHNDSDSDVSSVVSSVSSSTSEVTFEVGSRCEATDYTGKWYPCKIIAVDWNRRKFKVHFEYWNAKFDQWMPMDTNDIRPPQAASKRKQEKPSRTFKTGDKVHARWSDGRKYPAKILSKAGSGMYEVLFFDGFKKEVSEKRLEFMTPAEATKVKFSTTPVLAPERSQLGPVTASKAGREKPVERIRESSNNSSRRKRTLTDKASEFFAAAKKPKLEKSKDEEPPSPRVSQELKTEVNKKITEVEESIGPWRFIPVQRENRQRVSLPPKTEKKTEKEAENLGQLAAIELLSPIKTGRKRNDSDVDVELAELVGDGKKSSEESVKTDTAKKTVSSEKSPSKKKHSVNSKGLKAETTPSPPEKGKRSQKTEVAESPPKTNPVVVEPPPVVDLESGVIENVNIIKMVDANDEVQDCDEVRVSLSLAGQQALIEKDNIPVIQIDDDKDAPYVIPLQETPKKKSKEVKWSEEEEVLHVNLDAEKVPDGSIQAQVVVKSAPLSPRALEPTKRSARIRSKSEEQEAGSPKHKVEVAKKIDVGAVEEITPADSVSAKKKLQDWTVAQREFVVMQDHNAFKCPKEGCWKGFRKEDLLQMHIKHYHPEYTKYVSKAPKVMQLAARQYDEPTPSSPEVQPSYIKKIAQLEAKKTKKEVKPEPSKSEAVIAKAEKKKEKERLNREVQATLEDVLQSLKKTDASPIPEEKSDVKKKSIDAFIHEELRKEAQWRSQKAKEQEEKEPEKVEKPKVEKVEKPKVEKVEKPKVEKVEKPKVEKIDILKKQEKVRKSKRLRSISQGEDDEEWTNETKKDSKKSKETDRKRKRNITESSEEELLTTGDAASKSLTRKDELQQDAKKMRLDSASTDSSRRDTEDTQDVQTDDTEQGWEDNIIFCSCGSNEEEGLMIQCELCLTWQHGACHDIDTNEQVPEKYICSKCLHPELQRESARYLHRQEWITEGKLARFEFIEGNGPAKNMEWIMKRSHDLCGNVLNLRKVVRSLRHKLKIAGEPNNPKMVQWAKPWDPPPPPTTTTPCSQLETSISLNSAIADLPIPTLGPVKLNLEELMGDIMNADFRHLPGELPQNGDKASDLNLPPIKEEPDNAAHLDEVKAEDVPVVSAQEDVTEVADGTEAQVVSEKSRNPDEPLPADSSNEKHFELPVTGEAQSTSEVCEPKAEISGIKLEPDGEEQKDADKPSKTAKERKEKEEESKTSPSEKEQLEMDFNMAMMQRTDTELQSKDCKAKEDGIQGKVPDDKDLIVEEVLKLQGVAIKKEPFFSYGDARGDHGLEAWTAGGASVLGENLADDSKDGAMINVDDIPLDDLLRDTDALELPTTAASSSVVVPPPRQPVNFPVPEKVIDFLDCRVNLLDHIENIQNQVDARLDWIESQLSALETADETLVSSANVWDSRMVNTVLRDLATVRKIASLTPKS